MPIAFIAAYLTRHYGHKPIFSIALMALTLRGLLIRLIQNPFILIPAETLDGISAGLIGVAAQVWL